MIVNDVVRAMECFFLLEAGDESLDEGMLGGRALEPDPALSRALRFRGARRLDILSDEGGDVP